MFAATSVVRVAEPKQPKVRWEYIVYYTIAWRVWPRNATRFAVWQLVRDGGKKKTDGASIKAAPFMNHGAIERQRSHVADLAIL